MNNSINPEFNNRAVSVYGAGDALDDFPVLKAFQQYIDAEQAKARKRLLAMGIFFGALMFIVIAIFVILLMNVTNRNQQLNDRLIEFAMKDRSTGSAVVVQPPQDSTAILALTTKLEDLQNKLAEAQSKADKALAEAEEKVRQANASAEAAKPKEPTPEEREIQRLKAQLAAEKEKSAAEKERRREEELEAYRRKHYPELYAPKQIEKKATSPSRAPYAPHEVIDQILDELDRIEDADGDDATIEKRPAEQDSSDVSQDSSSVSESGDLAPIHYFENPEQPPRRAEKANKTMPSPSDEKSAAHQEAHTISVPNGSMRVNWCIPD